MPVDYVKITTSSNQRAQRLARFVRLVREALDCGEEVKNLADHMVDDPNYSGMENTDGFGVPTSQGQTTYNLVAGAYARLNHVDIQAFINRLGE